MQQYDDEKILVLKEVNDSLFSQCLKEMELRILCPDHKVPFWRELGPSDRIVQPVKKKKKTPKFIDNWFQTILRFIHTLSK